MIRVAAGITVVILVFVGLLYLRDSGNDAPEGDTPVVVAARDITAGIRISEEMVRIVPVLEGEFVISGSYPDTAQVVGKVSKVSLVEGEQIADSKVFVPFGNPAAHEFRVLSLNIEPVASGQGVRRGDLVDILAAYDGAGTATTLVKNVQVLATTDRSSSRPRPESVTVALDAGQAEVLVDWREKSSKFAAGLPCSVFLTHGDTSDTLVGHCDRG